VTRERSALILGARSDIARACAQRLAADGHAVLMLAARNPDDLAEDARDLTIRHQGQVTTHAFDALDPGGFSAFLDGLGRVPDVVICAVGLLGEQAESAADPEAALRVMRSNFEGPALILGLIANRMEARGRGTIVGISSVAGERGRASNYVYGAAKAGFTAWLSGLRNRLSGKGVQVITVLPGFVATRMTAGMDLNPRLTAQPDEVAAAIARAMARGRDVVWVRSVWRLIMAIIRALPESVFKRTRL
jgi:decaprenylphospho-beta-D-erythro-pentofuranosid-2-ulose 2-reductase